MSLGDSVNIIVRPVTHAELRWASSNLRDEDTREIMTVTGMPPEDVLMACHSYLEIQGAFIGCSRAPAVIFGCTGIPPPVEHGVRVGSPWMLCTPEISKAPLAIFKESQKVVRRWMEEYDYLCNYADTRNVMHLRWIGLLGFQWGEFKRINGVLFRRFYKSRKENNV